MRNLNFSEDPQENSFLFLEAQVPTKIMFASPEENEDSSKKSSKNYSEMLIKRIRLSSENEKFKQTKGNLGQQFKQLNKNISEIGKRNDLKKIVKKHKIKNLVKNFRIKIKKNITMSSPVDFQPYQKKEGVRGFFSLPGIEMPKWLTIILQIIWILQFMIAFFTYGMALAYEAAFDENKVFYHFQIISLLLLVAQMISKSLCIKMKGDYKLNKVSQIIQQYVQNTFKVDFVCLIVLILELCADWEGKSILRLFFLLKLKEILKKIWNLEDIFVNNFEKEQYWGVTKVFILNFCIAHLIAVFLSCIGEMSEGTNWMESLGISQIPWNEKYSWAYYWAMSLMLGFGNATPANYQEAIYISVIQCISCILLAYNINYVGILITNIAQQNAEKEKNLKTSKRLAEQNQISLELHEKMNNFIRESDKIKKKFMFETDKQFVSSLPKEMRTQFLKQANKNIFSKLFFFQRLSRRCLLALSEKISIKIAHPQEIIFNSRTDDHLLILKKGNIGYFTVNPGSQYNKFLIDQLTINKNERPKLLHLLNFYRNSKDPEFMIKSLDHSIIYSLSQEEMLKNLKEFPIDYQKLFQLKEQSKHMVDEFETITCNFCETNHSRMKCPKLHYCPFPTLVCQKYLHSVKKEKNSRKILCRRKPSTSCLLSYGNLFRKMEEKILRKKAKGFNQSVKKGSSCKSIDLSEWKNDEVLNRFETFRIETIKDLQKKQHSKILKEIEERVSDIIKIQYQKANQIEYFWEVETDQLHDYSFFFPEQNPCELKEIFLCLTREENRSVCLLSSDNQIANVLQRILRFETSETEKFL